MKYLPLLLLCACAQAPRTDAIALAFRPQAGDSVNVTWTNELAYTVRMTGDDRVLDGQLNFCRRYTTDFLDVADGALNRRRFIGRESSMEFRTPGSDDLQRVEHPDYQRTFIVSGGAGHLVVEEGDVPPDMHLSMEPDFVAVLPSGEVAVGDSWSARGNPLRQMGGPAAQGDGTATFTFSEIRDVGGRRCAVIDLVVDCTVTIESAVTAGQTLKGQMLVWIDRGYPLSFHATGTLQGKRASPQGILELEGTVTIDMKAEPREAAPPLK